MLEEDIRQLQVILHRIVTLQADTPEKRQHLDQAYKSVVQAIAALEQLKTPIPSLHVPGEPVADLYEAITQEERFKEWL
ncbi:MULTISPECIES: hypothetical protein [unclassified Leptolyngbya]|uniref:hypothetical protein n=1 Tax=unclassified Leptolyngbya TaxID=2650499 RepID=UPI0016873AD0|nr:MULTISPECIES: hypothetical protein [unclassified Leptolyngbya]MBD1910800.1 hypothetical protein [Leptolyngbya sp. FACHB-8]MBD2157630.1 hypothetical protein [Leptolyngbya sp. FACHB-16]